MIENKQHGFTLVEIMVALAIGLFLTAGALQIFISTKGTNRVQENLSRMQENARFAMHFLTTDIRQAGYSGGICGGDIRAVMNAFNNLDSSSAEYNYAQFQPISGFDNVAGVGSQVAGTDEITVGRFPVLGAGITASSAGPSPTSAIMTNPSPSNIEQDAIVLITDCSHGDIFQKTNSASSATIAHGVAGGHTPGNQTASLSQTYSGGSRVYVLSDSNGINYANYQIALDSNGVPGLTRNNQQLIANIEDMQILYGEKTAGGNMFYLPANQVNMNDVVSVKISLLVRSPDDNVATSPQTIAFNGGPIVPVDRRLRKVYTSTIALRNRLQ